MRIIQQLVKKQLPDMADQQILTEPVMRNTAPCVAYGCFKIESINPDAAIVVAPSDHLILGRGRIYCRNRKIIGNSNQRTIA
jgi:mannose-1-phosphate guanylyltransferase